MEDHHYGQKENLTGPDIFDKPIDRTKSRQQAEQRFREPETDIREKLEQLPPLSKKTKRNIGIAGAVALVLTGVIWAGGSFFWSKENCRKLCGSCSAGRLEECLRKSGAAPGKAPWKRTVSGCYP